MSLVEVIEVVAGASMLAHCIENPDVSSHINTIFALATLNSLHLCSFSKNEKQVEVVFLTHWRTSSVLLQSYSARAYERPFSEQCKNSNGAENCSGI